MADQFLNPVLNEEYTGGLQGLDESAGETYRHTVFDPGITVPPDSHLNV